MSEDATRADARPNSTLSSSWSSPYDNTTVGMHLAEARLRWIIDLLRPCFQSLAATPHRPNPTRRNQLVPSRFR